MSDTPAAPDLEVFAIVRSDGSVDVWLDPAEPGIKHVRADTVQAQIDAAVKAERAAASEYCWQRYKDREPMNLTSPAVFTSHSHQDIVAHMERAAAIRKGEQP